jgi:uridine kinase
MGMMERLPAAPMEVESTPEFLTEQQLFDYIKNKIGDVEGGEARVISIVGGAASGKTTLANRLKQFLGSADTLGTDDYVVGDRKYRRENLEGKDPTLKYDPVALNQHIAAIKRLSEGEVVAVPTYNEQTGEALAATEWTHQIGKVDYIIVEGDFDFVENPDLLVYFDVSDDNRLMNRIRRDQITRGASEDEIRQSFELRQELQHRPHTEPTKGKADVVVKAHIVNDENDSRYDYEIAEE